MQTNRGRPLDDQRRHLFDALYTYGRWALCCIDQFSSFPLWSFFNVYKLLMRNFEMKNNQTNFSTKQPTANMKKLSRSRLIDHSSDHQNENWIAQSRITRIEWFPLGHKYCQMKQTYMQMKTWTQQPLSELCYKSIARLFVRDHYAMYDDGSYCPVPA